MSTRDRAVDALTAINGIADARANEAIDTLEAAGLAVVDPSEYGEVDEAELRVAYDSLANINHPRVQRAAEALADVLGVEPE